MKKILLSLVVTAGVAFFGNSKVLTVSNNPNSPGQYKDVQAACDAASENDTIYVHASGKEYNGAYVRKKLVFIGEGTIPNQQIGLRTYIGQLYFTYASFGGIETTSLATSSGSKVYGCEGKFVIGTDKDRSNLFGFSFERCGGQIENEQYTSSNDIKVHQFIGSVKFNSSVNQNTSNILITNSILYGVSIQTTLGSLVYNNVVRNCIININSASISATLVVNNIFYKQSLGDPLNDIGWEITAMNSTFSNNLYYSKALPNFNQNGYNTNSASGNLASTDSIFVFPHGIFHLPGYGSYGPEFPDFHLKLGSPALTMGTDGTQIGIYGGPTPWIDGGDGIFRYGTMPSQVPYVTDMDILNTVIQENGTLNVNIKAKVQD